MMVGPELIIILLVAVLAAVIFVRNLQPIKWVDVRIGKAVVRAEVADNVAKQIKGLMFRSSLKENEGMLFDFGKEGYPGIWMMNTSIPLDIIWINNGKVVDIKKDAHPCRIVCLSYGPKEQARYVLEVNANFTDRHNIKIGTKVELD
jgi:hypothetical protein